MSSLLKSIKYKHQRKKRRTYNRKYKKTRKHKHRKKRKTYNRKYKKTRTRKHRKKKLYRRKYEKTIKKTKIKGGMDRPEGQKNETFECPVCLENFSITNGIKCGNNHYTCYLCADNIIKSQTQPSCPICRDENGGWQNQNHIINKAREIREEERKNDPMSAWYDSDDENDIIRCSHPGCGLFTKLQNGYPIETHNIHGGFPSWRNVDPYGWFCPLHDHVGNQLNPWPELKSSLDLRNEGFTNREQGLLEYYMRSLN